MTSIPHQQLAVLATAHGTHIAVQVPYVHGQLRMHSICCIACLPVTGSAWEGVAFKFQGLAFSATSREAYLSTLCKNNGRKTNCSHS